MTCAGVGDVLAEREDLLLLQPLPLLEDDLCALSKSPTFVYARTSNANCMGCALSSIFSICAKIKSELSISERLAAASSNWMYMGRSKRQPSTVLTVRKIAIADE